jgi:hypothetical protein
MHLFVNNMADPDISDYEFDADDHNCIVFENFTASIGDFDGFKSSLQRTQSQVTSDLYILNWKSSYDVTLFMCKSRSTIFPGILFFCDF